MKNKYKFTIERVIDGDTVVGTIMLPFNLSLHARVRIENVDTYELREQGGKEAKLFVENKLFGLQALWLATDGEYDSFGRVIGDIYYGDTVSLSEALYLNGFDKYNKP